MRISFKPSSAGGLPKNTWRTLDYPQRNSEHLLALAVVAAAHEKRLSVGEPSSFRYTPGKGVRATVDGDAILDYEKTVQLRLEQLPLGLVPDGAYATRGVTYSARDLFLMVTDGITEVANERDEEFIQRMARNPERVPLPIRFLDRRSDGNPLPHGSFRYHHIVRSQ